MDQSGVRGALPPTDLAFSIQHSAFGCGGALPPTDLAFSIQHLAFFHFIGLGGIGMSALARVLLQRGCKVQGSDASGSSLLAQLEKEGAKVRVGHSADWIDRGMAVVYSTDIKESNVELIKARELGLPLFHRSAMLDCLMEGKKSLLVTGTHGKTTTTALLSAALCEAGWDPSFVIGGILRSMNANGKAGKGEFFVAEADESDGSFLRTAGYGAIVTNLEDEHMNYWGSEERLDDGFRKFFDQTEKGEHLFWCCDDARLAKVAKKGISYGFSETAELHVMNYRQAERGIAFDLSWRGKDYKGIELSLFGRHNALNGSAVFGLGLSLGVSEQSLREAFCNFSGTLRRLECKGEAGGVTLYDDYGHHPTEIAATLKALRERVRDRRLCVVFQPHRYTRVRDLFNEFLDCFEDADSVILTDIYSAGEAPIEGASTENLFERMRQKLGRKLQFIPRQELEAGIAQIVKDKDVVLTIGAGDVTRAGLPILEILKNKKGAS